MFFYLIGTRCPTPSFSRWGRGRGGRGIINIFVTYWTCFYWNPQFESIEIESILKAETREREMNITLKENEKETKRSQLKTTPQTLVKYPKTSLTTTPKPSEAGEKKTFKNLLKTAKKPDQQNRRKFSVEWKKMN